jgi:hypothetical protein
MTVEIYIWLPEAVNSEFSALTYRDVGHASMHIENIMIDISKYISHRPLLEDNSNITWTMRLINKQCVNSVVDLNFTYERECKDRRRKAEKRYIIKGLDELRICLRYEQLIKSHNGIIPYGIIGYNCCDIIIDCILRSFKKEISDEFKKEFKQRLDRRRLKAEKIGIFNEFTNNLIQIWEDFRENLFTPEDVEFLLNFLQIKYSIDDESEY